MQRKEVKDLADLMYMLAHYEEATVSERRTDIEIPNDMQFEIRGAFLLGYELKRFGPKHHIQPFFDLVESGPHASFREAFHIIKMKEKYGFDLIDAFKLGLMGKR